MEHRPSLIPVILDRFYLKGPNGTHPCLVTLPARCSLRDAREASGSYLFQLDVARSLAAQLVLAVSLVHSQGYAHGGEHLVAPDADNPTDTVLQIFISAIFCFTCPHPSTTYRYSNCTHSTGSRRKSQSFVSTPRQHQQTPGFPPTSCLQYGWANQATRSPWERRS